MGLTHRMCCAQPIAVQAGIQGNENDRGAYKLTQIYQRPDDHLLPNHQGLFDGVFQGPVHCKTTMEGLLPASKRELRNAPTVVVRNNLRAYNRVQRRLRVVIEQLFGIIKQWALVGNTVHRADLELQGINFYLCTLLTAWLLEKRDSYPRGRRWRNAQTEAWEDSLGEWLEVDPLCPDLY